MRILSLGLLFGAFTAHAADAPQSVLELSAQVPAESDGCLDHSVKELGMSAKRVEKERRWKIGPQFLHPSIVPQGTVTVELKASERSTAVVVTVTWPGDLKPKAIQAELEERAAAMVTKMSQVCGVTRPQPACVATAAGQTKSSPCAAR